MDAVKKLYNDIPQPVKRFLVRAAIFFVIWRLLYYFIFEPTKIPDQQLIDIVIIGTKWVLSFVYDSLAWVGDVIIINGKPTLQVAKDCNGLELIVVYLGFLVCWPTNPKRFWTFALIGPVIITLLNILRCSALGVMFYNDHKLADFAHHYFFKLIIYAVTFWLWVKYSKKQKPTTNAK
jgi:exosortase/archaeosortase family protein